MRNEIKALTGLRGVAALIVAIYHCTLQKEMPLTYTPRFLLHGYLAVDLFFVLSGFVLTLNYARLFRDDVTFKATGAFLFKRFARIYPVYFAVSVFASIRYGHRYAAASFYQNLDLIGNLFLIQSWGFGLKSILGNAWSVSTEVLAYLLFPLLIFSIAQFRAVKQILLILAIAGILTVYYFGHGVNGPLDSNQGMFALTRCFSGFIVGTLAFEISRNQRAVEMLSSKTFNNGALCCVAVLIAIDPDDLVIFFSFPILVLLLYINRFWGKAFFGNPAVYYLGIISYSLYLVHPFAQGFIRAHMGKLGYHSESDNGIGILITLTLSCVLASLSYYVAEEPGRRVLLLALRRRRDNTVGLER